MSTEKWRRLLLDSMHNARTILIEYGEIPGLFTIYRPEGYRVALSMPFLNSDQKRNGISLLRVATIAYQADGLLTMIEAWAASVEKTPGEDFTPEQIAELVPAKDHPSRQEVVFGSMSFYDEDGARQSILAMGKIRRDGAGKVIDLAEIEIEDDPHTALLGTMASILPERRFPKEHSERAMAIWKKDGPVLRAIVGMKERLI